MISLSSVQLDAWIAALAFPLARILGFVSAAPLWNVAGIPKRTRLVLGLCIAVAITPVLPAMPVVQAGSLKGLALMAEQMLIGLGMGFAVKVVFAGIEMAGDFIGLQMGLGFATFYDPLSSSQTPVLSEFFNLLAMLLFLSLNGHLIYLATLAESFSAIPVGASFLGAGSWRNLAELGGKIFATGLLLSLPLVVALLITNIALAVLTRAAPQLNIFSLGFPVTLLGGFAILAIGMSYLAAPLQAVFELAMQAMLGFAVPGSAR